jgi:hypothetical protein
MYDLAQALGAFAWVRKSSDSSILLSMLSLAMLQRYEAMTIDEILTVWQPDFTWRRMFLAIDRLSRQKRIMLYPVGLNYHISLMNDEQPLGREQQHEAPVAQHR